MSPSELEQGSVSHYFHWIPAWSPAKHPTLALPYPARHPSPSHAHSVPTYAREHYRLFCRLGITPVSVMRHVFLGVPCMILGKWLMGSQHLLFLNQRHFRASRQAHG